MISSLFLLNDHGEVIIEMQFREKVPRSTIEAYWSSYVAPLRFLEEAPAVVTYNNIVFSHILRNRVFLLAAVREEGSALLALETLDMITRLLTAYLREFTEMTLRENFSLVYQLLQEILDYGYPLTTEVFALEELVPRPTLENKVRAMLDTQVPGRTGASSSSTVGIGARQVMSDGSVPWRDPATTHHTNEILFDLVESMDYIMDSDGRTHKASVRGAIEVNCRLSGKPDVLLQLVNTDVLDDVGFHRCARLSRYVGDNAVSFVPPDGKFTLMQYTCAAHALPATPPPFYVTPQVSFNQSGGRFNCMVGLRAGSAVGSFSLREPEKEVQKLVVRLLLPPHTASMTVGNCSMGSTTFERSRGVLTWTIGNLGRNSASLGGEFTFDAVVAGSSGSGSGSASNNGNGNVGGARKQGKAAIKTSTGSSALPPSGAMATAMVSFQIPNYSVSGLRVDTVRILNEMGKPYKGVKYTAQSGNFIVRTS